MQSIQPTATEYNPADEETV